MHIDEQTYLTLQTENIHFKIEISIQHYVITFVSDLRQVGGFLRVLRFPPPIKLTAAISLKYCRK
jgi:hypothetical protein